MYPIFGIDPENSIRILFDGKVGKEHGPFQLFGSFHTIKFMKIAFQVKHNLVDWRKAPVVGEQPTFYFSSHLHFSEFIYIFLNGFSYSSRL
jgi:hypothetical protein